MTCSSSRSISGTSPTGCKIQSKHIRWSLRTDRGRPRPTLAPFATFREKRRTTRTRWPGARLGPSPSLPGMRPSDGTSNPARLWGRTGSEKEKESRHRINTGAREGCWGVLIEWLSSTVLQRTNVSAVVAPNWRHGSGGGVIRDGPRGSVCVR